ncbi:MAG: type II secretion system protein [Candidatus Saccharibacteria bacterium]
MSSNNGFTLIEVLIVIAIMTVVGAIALPVSVDYQRRNDLDVAQVSFVQGARRAQQLSISGEGDSQWGVTATSGNIVIFKGSTYATRDASYDENYDISSAIVSSGQVEYDFAKVTGLPAQTGSATFTNDSYVKTVGVNAKGIVNY